MTQTLTRGTETTVGRAVGQPVDRIDGTAKATGTATYAADYSYPELAHAALVHATVARGRITTIDTGEAATVSGVLAVLTHENAPPMRLPRSRNPMSAASGAPVNYLHTDEVHWNGQPVAMVVAETLAAAEEAAALVRVHCEPITATVDFAAEQRNAKPAPGIPLVMPAFLAGVGVVFIRSMTAISATIFLVSIGWTLITVRILENMTELSLGPAAAFSVFVIAVVMGVMALLNAFLRRLPTTTGEQMQWGMGG